MNKNSNESRYKREDLIVKYMKATEGSDGVYDMLQLLGVVCSFGTIYFAVCFA